MPIKGFIFIILSAILWLLLSLYFDKYNFPVTPATFSLIAGLVLLQAISVTDFKK